MARLLTHQGAATAFCGPGCQALTTRGPAQTNPAAQPTFRSAGVLGHVTDMLRTLAVLTRVSGMRTTNKP